MAQARARPRSAPSVDPAPGAGSAPSAHASGTSPVPEPLQQATEEAARLLGADGAFLYLLDPASGRLRFTHDAGIERLGQHRWVRRLEIDVGVGMFGRAVAERRVLVTGDYPSDTSFVHASGPDRVVREVSIRSFVVAPLVAGDEVFGALGTFSREPDAFTAPQIALVRALADHAAISMANARLIEELDRSRKALERQALVERSLRELGTRISGARDPGAVVQHTIDEALRLLDGDGARIDIVDPELRQLRGLFSAGQEQISEAEWPRDPDDHLEVGASGRAVVTGRTYVTGDYLADDSIEHSIGPDTYVRAKGIRSVIATPLFGDQGPFGAITVWSTRVDAFGPEDEGMLETIAGQSAVALGRARLIEELGRSREALARRAEEESALREIGGRLAKLGDDPGDVLLRIVHEAARLLGAERARLDLVEETSGASLWTFPADTPFRDGLVLGASADGRPIGLAGLAVREGRAVGTDDYLLDDRFDHYAEGDRAVMEVELRSLLAAPVSGEDGLLGAIQVGSRRPRAFNDDAARLLEALAGQASVAITNARLVDRLATSQQALARTAEAERALREIARRLMTIQDPGELLQDVVDEAARLLGSSGAVIDLLDPATGEVRWAHDAGLDDATRAEWQRRAAGSDGVLQAIRERRVLVIEDYAGETRFQDDPADRAFFERAGIRSIAFAPFIGEATVLGTLAVFSGEIGRFGEQEAALLGALADLATIAIHNAELIRELGRSREETARRAETERTLREIAARVTAIRDPETILGLIVDEARRVLGSDGAHLTRMSDDRTYLRPVVVAGGRDEATRDWLRRQEFPLDGGINGLAAGHGRLVWTPSYATDPRIPRERDDLDVAELMGLGAMAAAPLRAPGGDVIGTLAVSYREPGPIAADRLATLQALADHAAIALSNSDLLARLEASESGYRLLVQASPDTIWRNDAEGRFTFVADSALAQFGWRPEDLVGQHFSSIVADESMADAVHAWEELQANPGRTLQLRYIIRRGDGRTVPTEISSVAVFEDGRFTGAQGTVRDISARERLEFELRSSEERFRFLVENAPDVVFSADAQTRFIYMSDTIEQLTGWRPEELVGETFDRIVTPDTLHVALERWEAISDDPTLAQVLRLELIHKQGGTVPVEIHSVGQVDAEGRFAGVHGSARDISERERLEAELRESEERYRSVIQSSPDLIWATNKSGRYVFVSDRVRDLLGWDPAEVLDRPFREFIDESSIEVANAEWERLAREPGRTQTQRLDIRHRDGSVRPFEVSSVAVVRDGQVENVYGIARDIAERERLERDLRESEERYRYLVHSSPDLVWMTDHEGRFTFVSDQASSILGWEPDELLGRSFADLAPAEGRRSAIARYRWLQRRPTDTQRSRLKVMTRDGRELAMEITGIGMVADGQFVGAHGAARDVSERDRLERDLRRQAVELASSEERAHLARELHDSVTQALFSMTLLSRSAELLLDKDPAQVPGKLAALRELQRDALAEMRALIFELRPGNIEENGLIHALRTHCASLSGRIGLPVVVEAELAERPPIDVEEALYRIAQEALHNVVKHAGARQVRVEVGRVAEGVRLRVIDDGRGFDPGAVPEGHLGLAGMQARAERLGGRLSVTSTLGQGTTIEVVVPERTPVTEPAPDEG